MDVQVNHPTISVDFKTERVYPELEDLEVNPTMKEQTFKSNKYGFNEVKVKGFEGPVLDTENPIEITNIDNVIKISIEGDAVIKITDDKTAIITSVETDVIKIEEIENYVDPQKVLYAEEVERIVTNAVNSTTKGTNVWAVVEYSDGNIYLLTPRGNTGVYLTLNTSNNFLYITSDKTLNTCKNMNIYKWDGAAFVYQSNNIKVDESIKVVEIIGCGSPVYKVSDKSVYQDVTKLVEYGDY